MIKPWMWWLAGTVSGLGMGTVVGIWMVLYPYYSHWSFLELSVSSDAGTPPDFLTVTPEILLFYSLRGVILGCAASYIMVWLSPLLQNWPMRFVVGAIVGTLVAAFCAPGITLEVAVVQGIAGLISSLIGVAWVKRLAESSAHQCRESLPPLHVDPLPGGVEK